MNTEALPESLVDDMGPVSDLLFRREAFYWADTGIRDSVEREVLSVYEDGYVDSDYFS